MTAGLAAGGGGGGAPEPCPLNSVKIHFTGHKKCYDDWIRLDSDALAPFRCFTTRSVSLNMLSVKDIISKADPMARTTLAFSDSVAPWDRPPLLTTESAVAVAVARARQSPRSRPRR